MTWDLRDKEASSTSSSETIEWASRSTRRRRGARGFGSARSSCSSPPSFGTKPEPKTRDDGHRIESKGDCHEARSQGTPDPTVVAPARDASRLEPPGSSRGGAVAPRGPDPAADRA